MNTYSGSKSEWVVMANAYVDLGTWWCITPFIGAGVGGARVAINGFTDQGIANNGGGALPGLAYGDSVAKWNFAWAAHAGLAYKVTPSFRSCEVMCLKVIGLLMALTPSKVRRSPVRPSPMSR